MRKSKAKPQTVTAMTDRGKRELDRLRSLVDDSGEPMLSPEECVRRAVVYEWMNAGTEADAD